MQENPVQAVRAVIDELLAASLWSRPEAQALHDTRECWAALQSFEALYAAMVADLEGRVLSEGLSVPAFLKSALHRTAGQAANDARVALNRLPHCGEAFTAGAISRVHMEVITRTVARISEETKHREVPPSLPELGGGGEPVTVIEAIDVFFAHRALEYDSYQLQCLARAILAALDANGADGFDPAAYERRQETHVRDENGLLHGTFTLDAVNGAALAAAIDHYSAPLPMRTETADDGSTVEVRDSRTPAQRRADAVGLIARLAMSAAHAGRAGEPPRIVLYTGVNDYHDTHCPNPTHTTPPPPPTAEPAPAAPEPAQLAPGSPAPSRPASPNLAAESSNSAPVSSEPGAPESAPRKSAPPETEPADAAPRETAAQTTTAPEAADPEEAARDAGGPEAVAPEAGAPKAAAPKAAAPEAAAPEAAAPEAAAPEAGAPEAIAPEGAPEDAAAASARPEPAPLAFTAVDAAGASAGAETPGMPGGRSSGRMYGATDTHLGPIGTDLLARFACDAVLQVALMHPTGAILGLGRDARTISAAQRRALAARDRGCVIPGCTAPARWCEGHHVTYWSQGGLTDLDNLALVCGHHHTMIHLGLWTLRMINGVPWARPSRHVDPQRRWIRNTYHEDLDAARGLGVQLRLGPTSSPPRPPVTREPDQGSEPDHGEPDRRGEPPPAEPPSAEAA